MAPKGNLTDAEIIKIINKYSKELKESIEMAEKANRPEFSQRVREELKIVEEFLRKHFDKINRRTSWRRFRQRNGQSN